LPKSGLPQLWSPITLCVDLWSQWGPKQNCSPHRKLSNGISHTTYTQGNRVDSRLLVVENQTANLTPSLSFGHNLCFRCPNGWCEPILDIYVLITFQRYKKLFKPLGFDPCNHSFNIQESTKTLTPNMGVHLGMWRFFPSHSFALPGHKNATPELNLSPHPWKPFALVVSPKLGSWQYPNDQMFNLINTQWLVCNTPVHM
jgi:hypothetical protein